MTLRYEETEFWYIDEVENAIDNLDMLSLSLEQPSSVKWWKWAIIAAHQALYSFAIVALSKTSPLYNIVVQNRSAKIHQLFIHEDRSVDEIAQELNISKVRVKKVLRNGPHVISIREALIRLQLPKEKHCLPGSNSHPLKMSQIERRAIKRLIGEFRNNFEHFYPKSWAIDSGILKEMLSPTVRVIRFIALESNCIVYQDEHLERVLSSLYTIESKVEELNT